MKSIKLWVTLMILAALGAGGYVAIKMRKNAGQEAKAKEAAESARVVQVKFAQPRKGALERLCVQPGSVHSFESIDLYAKVPGFLAYQKVDIGAKVVKGDVLAKLYVPDIEAQVERNKAAVDKAASVVKQMEARVMVARANKKAADAEVSYAMAMEKVAVPWLNYRDIQLGRMIGLVKKGAVEEKIEDEAKEKRDAAKETLEAAKVKIETTEANVKAMEAKIEQTEADVKEAEADVKVAQAELKKAEVNLEFATIQAPFNGKVTYRSMNPGDFVRAANEGGTPLLTVRRTDLFRVVVLVPDRDADLIEDGLPAVLTIDSLPDRTFFPKVSRYAEALDSQTRLMRVELDLYHDKEGKICSADDIRRVKHDMYGQAAIVLDRGKNWLSIPTSCIAGKIENGKGSVYVIKSGKLKKIELKLGMDSGLRVVVEKVLTPNEALTEESQVVVEPSAELAKLPEITAVTWDDRPTIKLTKTER